MKILVTGATGFLGSHLLKALLHDGHEVAILKRSFSNTWRIKDIVGQLISYDLDKCKLDEPFKRQGNFDAVIHTATSYGRKEETIREIATINTLFPLELLETASSFQTPIFINTDTVLNKCLNAYSLSKKHFMEWGKYYAFQRNVQFVNIKLEHIYGPKDDTSKFTTFIIKSCLDNVPEINLTLGEQKRDFIYIDDAVDAYIRILRRNNLERFQDYELGSGKTVSIREFVETVHQMAHSRTVLNFGAIPYREEETMESKADIKALMKIGWMPQFGLSDGIKACLADEEDKH